MKVVVYWENPIERAAVIGFLPLFKRWVHKITEGDRRIAEADVVTRSLADGLAEEKAEFNAQVAAAFAAPTQLPPQPRRQRRTKLHTWGGDTIHVPEH